jgi:hypothetical protein
MAWCLINLVQGLTSAYSFRPHICNVHMAQSPEGRSTCVVAAISVERPVLLVTDYAIFRMVADKQATQKVGPAQWLRV